MYMNTIEVDVTNILIFLSTLYNTQSSSVMKETSTYYELVNVLTVVPMYPCILNYHLMALFAPVIVYPFSFKNHVLCAYLVGK